MGVRWSVRKRICICLHMYNKSVHVHISIKTEHILLGWLENESIFSNNAIRHTTAFKLSISLENVDYVELLSWTHIVVEFERMLVLVQFL